MDFRLLSSSTHFRSKGRTSIVVVSVKGKVEDHMARAEAEEERSRDMKEGNLEFADARFPMLHSGLGLSPVYFGVEWDIFQAQ